MIKKNSLQFVQVIEGISLIKALLFLCNYVFPFVGFPFFLWLWTRSGSLAFAGLVMGLPLVFGYLIPGIATNVLKLWRFRGPLVVGNFFVHQGFVYAATFGMELYVGFFPATQMNLWAFMGNILRTAAMTVVIGWTHDLLAVREGVIEIYNGPWKRGAGPEAIVSHAAPLCYALLGGIYGAVATLGYQLLVVQQGNSAILWWLFPLGLVLMALASSVPYLLMEPR